MFPFNRKSHEVPLHGVVGTGKPMGDIWKWLGPLLLADFQTTSEQREEKAWEEDQYARACVSSMSHVDYTDVSWMAASNSAPWTQPHYTSLL